MTPSKRVGVVGGQRLVMNLFRILGHHPEKYDLDKSFRYYDMVVWCGGPDVSPYLYRETKLDCTFNAPFRDEFEKAIYFSLDDDIPKVGICRGAQFLCVMGGGSLWQDVDGHDSTHYATDQQGVRHLVTSTHHQMMRPPPHAVTLLTANCATMMRNDKGLYHADVDGDIEAIYIKENSILAFQPHPEYGVESCQRLFTDYLKDLFR